MLLPQQFGAFGCSIGAFKLYDHQSTRDDAAVGATGEKREVGGTNYSINGNAYVFGAHPTNKLSANPLRLDPGVFESGQEVGDLGLAAGKMKPSHQHQTLYVSAHLRDYDLGAGLRLLEVGGVDGYRFEGSITPKQPLFAGLGLNPFFAPVVHPSSSTGLVDAHQGFGSVIRVIDVDGDTFLDLVVGAPTIGRVYIFWGDASIPEGVHPTLSKVTILDAPHPSHNNLGGGFGNDIAAGDVDGDGKGDLLVGQPKWGSSSSVDFQGRAYLFLGGSITKPSGTTMVIAQSSFDLLFEPPPQAQPPPCTNRQPNFGWYLWMADVDGDQLLDLLIHAESECWPGTANGGVAVGTTPSASSVDRVGALYIWRNSSCTSPLFCTAPDLQLFGPAPKATWRFSKHVVVTKWWNTATASEQMAMIASEPETEFVPPPPNRPKDQAGTILLYFLSDVLALGSAPTSLAPSWQLFNTFMDFPGLGSGPSNEDLFGRFMATGNFGGGASPSRPQVLVTASGHQVPDPANPANPILRAGCAAHLEQSDPP